MNPFFSWQSNSLVWMPERGMGYYPMTDCPYDKAYWQKYIEYSKTPMGEAITSARVALVSQYNDGPNVVDIGIGCGAFVQAVGCYGFDVNPIAIDWLKKRSIWFDPYKNQTKSATFWDSLEHIEGVDKILSNVTDKVFVTLPIFDGPEHVLRSKHYRKDEHFWYFTHDGFIDWMAYQGFLMIYCDDMENSLGREDTKTYVFER